MKKTLSLLFLLACGHLQAACATGVLDRFCTTNTVLGDCGAYSVVNNGPVSFNTSPAPPIGTYNAGTFSQSANLTATAALITQWKSLNKWSFQARARFNTLNNLTSTIYSWGTKANQTHLNLVRALNNGALRLFVDGSFTDTSAGLVTTGTDYYIAVVDDAANIKVYVSLNSSISSTPALTVAAVANRSDIDYISLGDDLSGVPGVSDCPLDGYLNAVEFFNIQIVSFPTDNPVLTPTPTSTPTWTITPTVTPTVSPSPTFTATGTNTPTATRTASPTPTPSPSPTWTPTASPTNTPLPTATHTPAFQDYDRRRRR